MPRRLDAYPTWLAYSGLWGFVAALSWVATPVYLVSDVGMSPLQLVLAGTALEVVYSVFEVPTGSSRTSTAAGSPWSSPAS